jgi:hypothetical protein
MRVNDLLKAAIDVARDHMANTLFGPGGRRQPPALKKPLPPPAQPEITRFGK